jgi:hypothetical protein
MGCGDSMQLRLGSKCPVKRPSCRTPTYLLKMIGCCEKHEGWTTANWRICRTREHLGIMISSSIIILVPSPGRGTTPINCLDSTTVIVRRRLFEFEKHVFDCLTYCGTASSSRFTDLVLVSCFTSRLSEANYWDTWTYCKS